MNTPEDIIKVAKISQYLIQDDIQKKGLYGGGIDLLLPQKIYNIRKSVEWANNNETLPANATSTITITSGNGNVFINYINVYVDDPILGVILLGNANSIGQNASVNDIAYALWTGINNSDNNYGYNPGVEPINTNTFTITAPSGRGQSMNGISIYLGISNTSFGYTITPFAGGKNEVNLNATSTSNYLNALCGKYGLEAANLINQYGGLISSITYPMSVPTPIEFIVSSTSLIPTNSSSAVVNSFIGFNLLFIRNGISQSILNNGGSYFSWNKDTGVFICYPIASEGELFQLYPFI